MFADFRQDIRRKAEVFAEDGAEISFFRALLTDGTSANFLYRCMRWSDSLGIFPLTYLLQFTNKLLNQCVIGASAHFEPGFVLMHPNGVVINSAVSGGANVTIESGVVIGAEKGQSPSFGNNIFVGAGAKVIGGIIVADGAKIGANAVVVKPVAAGTTVVGIPAKPITRN